MTNAQWTATDRDWRHTRDQAIDRIRQDLPGLLRNAGHVIPDPDICSLDRYSDDALVMTFIDLANTDPPESAARYSVLEQFPCPGSYSVSPPCAPFTTKTNRTMKTNRRMNCDRP